MSARKYILIPEYRPLYAMARCWGPLHGPLSKPTPTPIDVIGELLQQTGNEQVTIYETKPDPNHPNQMLPHIRLTRDNYMLPYDEIAGRSQSTKSIEKVSVTTPEIVEPTIVEDAEDIKNEPVSEEVDTGEAETAVYQEPEQEETVPETVDTPSETAVTAVIDTTPADSVPEVESISTEDMPAATTGYLTTEDDQNTTAPDAVTVTGSAPEQRVHMTKAERRAARRAAEAAKNQAEQN